MNRCIKRVAVVSTAIALTFPQGILPPTASAQIFEGFTGCPVGTQEGAVSFVINGDFSANAGTGQGIYIPPVVVPAGLGFTSILPYRGDSVYPDDPIGGLSIQSGPFPLSYLGGQVQAVPFPGDPLFGIPPINTFLYSNPNASSTTPLISGSAFPSPIIWNQIVTGLRPNTSYNFSAYFYNLLDFTAVGAPPVIRFLSGPPGGPPSAFVPTLAGFSVGDGSAQPGIPASQNTRQRWIRVQGVFRTSPGQTSLELRIEDEANTIIGDDFGMTAVGLRECVPRLGIAKSVGTPIANPNGTFTIPYTVLVRNFAPAGSAQYNLTNLRLTDDLVAAFAGATVNSVTNLQSPTLTVNPNFNGGTDQNLVLPGNTLAAGASASVTFSVTITPGTGATGFGPFNNTTIATGTSQGGTDVSDRSDNGTNPDPDGDGDPNNNNNPTSITLRPGTGGGGTPRFRLVKRVTNVLRNGVPLPGINFNTFVDAPGDDDNAPGWGQLLPQGAPIGVPNFPASSPLQSGDQIEYTIYFLSDGNQVALGVNLCDAIPPSTRYVPNTVQVRRGNTSPIASGVYLAPLVPLPNGNPCTNQTNLNGTLLFDVGDIPPTPGDNVGFAQFKVIVE